MLALSFLAVCFFFTSCATTGSNATAGSKPIPPQIIESDPNIPAPDWVNSTTDFWEKDGYYFYRATSESCPQADLAKRTAQGSAVNNIAEELKRKVRAVFANAIEAGHYDPNVGGYTKNVFLSVVENTDMANNQIKMKESYVRYMSEITSSGERRYYKAYILACVSKDDYKKLAERIFTNTSAQVTANKSAKELVAETEKLFYATENLNNK